MNLSHSTKVAFLVAATFFMENLDATVIVTAMPQMAHSFGVAAVDLNVAISSYLIALAAFIPISGWLADRFGARLVFASAIAMFSFASLLCGLSSSLEAFIGARILQGISGAMMVPVGRLAVLRATEKKDLVKAIGYITAPALIAPVLGPPLGGLMVTYASWPWIFYINLPLGLLAFIATFSLISNERTERSRPFDWLGFILLGSTCAALLYGFEWLGQDLKNFLPASALCLGALLLGACSVWHMRRSPHPLLDLSVISIPTYKASLIGASLFRACITALPFLLPLMFQLAFGLSAVTAGFLVIAVFAGNLAMKACTTWVINRWGFRQVLVVNGALGVIAIAVCASFDAAMDHRLIMLLLFLGGLSRSLQFTAYNTLGFADVPQPQMSNASTLFSMIFQLSMGLGVAIAALLLRGAMMVHGNDGTADTADFQLAFVLLSIMALVAMYDSFRLQPQAGAAVLNRP